MHDARLQQLKEADCVCFAQGKDRISFSSLMLKPRAAGLYRIRISAWTDFSTSGTLTSSVAVKK
jgi:hypothetical protein